MTTKILIKNFITKASTNTIYLSLGSNIGNRYQYIQTAISLLSSSISDIKHSKIYETKPWGYNNQNPFLNMVIEGKTKLSPVELLEEIHHVQSCIGRQKTTVNGPRTIDIDIVFYDNQILNTKDLIIPHPRAHERDFVMVPMMDINPDFPHPVFNKTITELFPMDEPYILNIFTPTQIVGILNLSPESFGSESYTDIPSILARAAIMVDEGVDIIDIGAQSTKPGTPQISEEEELKRLEGVIQTIKAQFPTLRLSLDTTRATVARYGLSADIDFLNDISGLRFDSDVITDIVNTDVKVVVMHSQGVFADMHKQYQYDNIITELLEYFQRRTQELLKKGLRRDQIILDPGIGFSKGAKENFLIIQNLEKLKSLGFPIYIGLSRKRFIGTTTDREHPEDRDAGSTVLHTACIQKGADFIRTHNVGHAKDSIKLLTQIL